MSKETIIEFTNNDIALLLFGDCNRHLNYIEEKLNIRIADRGGKLRLSGKKPDIQKAEITLKSLYTRLQERSISNVSRADIDAELRFLTTGKKKTKTKMIKEQDDKNQIVIKTKQKTIAPRSPNQAEYLRKIQSHDMTFGLGPAGTGKTYLSVAAGIDLYLKGEVERLVFTRPAVEAGENLGFLPGDMKEKIDPYLRPIYDALQDMLPWDFLLKKMECGEIEIAPLAFMRGRTLARSFVILDEAQNTTCAQMKMFLTRMGESSHMVITGDATQTDLPNNVRSGLDEALSLLRHLEDDIGFMTFTEKDVIRHPLVRKIISAYDKKDS